jgi:hypothetical protein
VDGEADDDPLVSMAPFDTPVVVPVDGDVLLIPDVLPLDESFDMLLGELLLLGDRLFGDALLGEVLLDGSDGVTLLGAGDVLLPGVLDPLFDAGGLRWTSPVDVPVTVPLEAAPGLGMQSVVSDDVDDPVVADADAPAVGLAAAMPLIVATRPAAESAPVAGVMPVPFAPFVVFGPVKRRSGFVAGLRRLSVAVADVEPGLIVVVDE